MIETTRFTEFSLRRSWLGGEIEVKSADTARALFAKQAQLRYRSLVALVRSGLRQRVMIVADGEEWRRTRQAIVPHLHAACVARRQATVIEAVAEEAFAGIAARSLAGGLAPATVKIEVEPLMRGVTLSVMAHVLFGRALALDEAEELQHTLSLCMREISGIPGLINRAGALALHALRVPHWQRFVLPRAQRRAVRELLDWIGRRIDAQSEHAPVLDDLRSRLAGHDPRQLRRRIAAECMMLFIAGIETTAAALTFALAEIANNQTIRDAVTAEARRVHGPGSAEGLTHEYPCIYRVLCETLRRHTIVPTMLREAQSDQEIRGHRPGASERESIGIKRGTVLRYLPVRGNLRRDLWHEPLRFDPDRFAQALSAEQKKNYHTFGLGPQSCPGRALAIMEIILILRAFFRRLDLDIKPLTRAIPVERNALFTIRPVGVTVGVRAARPSSMADEPSSAAVCPMSR